MKTPYGVPTDEEEAEGEEEEEEEENVECGGFGNPTFWVSCLNVISVLYFVEDTDCDDVLV